MSTEPTPIPTAYDKADAMKSRVPCWAEIDGVAFLHDPERPDRLEAFQGHEWGSPCPDFYPE